MALIFRSIDIMGETKDFLDDPVSSTRSDKLIAKMVDEYTNLTGIGISIPMNTNAQAVAARGSAFDIEPSAYAQQFMDKIHAEGKYVLFRGTDCAFEGLYDFDKLSLPNGTRYSYFGDDITDSFSSIATRDVGYGVSIPAGSLAGYKTDHASGNVWTISSGVLVGPEADGWNRTCLYDADYIRDVTMLAKVKRVDNQMIVVRAEPGSGPGYGLQMRDAGTLRIEKPGLSNLGEVTGKAWVTGDWYWLKLQAIGTAIKGKSWADGDAEPGTWDIEITDTSYTDGYCGFGGESNNGQFDDMTITPTVDTTSWLYRCGSWLEPNIELFEDYDQVVPFPEASSHQGLTNYGDFNQFFDDLAYMVERIGTENGKILRGKYISHIWTSTIQGSYNSLFTDAEMATYDHYGTSLGLNKRFGSFSLGVVAGTSTYNLLSSISEGDADKCLFYPEKISYNTDIDVYVVDKGTGNWTMTIHTGANALVQMPDQHDFSSKTTTGVVTIPNASLTNGQFNTFTILWDNPVPDVQYHFHLTSSDGTGSVLITSGEAGLDNCVCRGYKATSDAKGMEIDIRKTYALTGVPQYLQEWGDYWSLDDTRSDPERTEEQHIAFLESMYNMFQDLVDDDILHGFNYWRATGGTEKLMEYDNDLADYVLLYPGEVLKDFFAGNFGAGGFTSPFPTFRPSVS